MGVGSSMEEDERGRQRTTQPNLWHLESKLMLEDEIWSKEMLVEECCDVEGHWLIETIVEV